MQITYKYNNHASKASLTLRQSTKFANFISKVDNKLLAK